MRHASLRLSLVLITAVLLTAARCSLRVTDAASVNRSLVYVDWSSGDCTTDTSTRTIAVQPGMRLTFHGSSLGAQNRNNITPRIERYEWIVPGERFAQDDYFVLGYLLAASSRDPNVDDIATLEAVAQPIASDKFQSEIQRQLYRPLVDSLVWHPSTTSNAATLCPKVAALRQTVAEPTKADFTKAPSETQLAFSVGATKFTFGGGATGFFNRDVVAFKPASPWYPVPPTLPVGARTLVTVDVPVRLQPELRSDYVPVYTSFADLERQLGIEVTGVRRSATFFDAITIEGLTRGVQRQTVIADDGYFTMWFGRRLGWARREKARGLVAKFAKSEMLVAPGDVILVNAHHRQHATDRPGVR